MQTKRTGKSWEQMSASVIKELIAKDAISAGYGIASYNIRKLAGKLLGKRGVGTAGVNVISIVAGTVLDQTNNAHAKVIGAALRVSGIAAIGNALVERIVSSSKNSKDEDQ